MGEVRVLAPELSRQTISHGLKEERSKRSMGRISPVSLRLLNNELRSLALDEREAGSEKNVIDTLSFRTSISGFVSELAVRYQKILFY